MLFYICTTPEEAEARALRLRQNNYNTQIKHKRSGSHNSTKVYEVHGILKLPRQLMVSEIKARKRAKIDHLPTKVELKEAEKWACETV